MVHVGDRAQVFMLECEAVSPLPSLPLNFSDLISITIRKQPIIMGLLLWSLPADKHQPAQAPETQLHLEPPLRTDTYHYCSQAILIISSKFLSNDKSFSMYRPGAAPGDSGDKAGRTTMGLSMCFSLRSLGRVTRLWHPWPPNICKLHCK